MIERKESIPTVSVVMGVKNAEKTISNTIDSILRQEDVAIELIIINDGSTDSTERVVQALSREDNRIKLVTRENKGLTISLIEGCDIAQGEFIARHDANDLSLSGRLIIQVNALRENNDASFCSTHVRHITKEGVGALVTGKEGIIHGSVMMRKSAYKQVGGYRSQFYYAQDLDLWSRLEEVGRHIEIPSIYYEALLYPESISGTRSQEQRKFFHLIKQASNARRNNEDEGIWLDKARKLSQRLKNTKPRTAKFAEGAYFIGSCLIADNPSLATHYFKKAICYNKLHLKSYLRLAGIR